MKRLRRFWSLHSIVFWYLISVGTTVECIDMHISMFAWMWKWHLNNIVKTKPKDMYVKFYIFELWVQDLKVWKAYSSYVHNLHYYVKKSYGNFNPHP